MPVFHSDKVTNNTTLSEPRDGQPMTIGGTLGHSSDELSIIVANQQKQIDQLKDGVDQLISMMKSIVAKQPAQQVESPKPQRVRKEIFTASSAPEDSTDRLPPRTGLDSIQLPPLSPPASMHRDELGESTRVINQPSPCVYAEIEPPVLKTLNVAQYQNFIADHKVYVIRGGTKRIEDCVAARVCRSLIVYAAPEDRKKPLMTLLRDRLAPKSPEEYFARLSGVKFRWSDSVDCVHAFNDNFLIVYDSAPHFAKDRATTIAKMYTRAVTIKKLRSPLYRLIDDGHVDLGMLGSFLVDQTTRLLADGWKLKPDRLFKSYGEAREGQRADKSSIRASEGASQGSTGKRGKPRWKREKCPGCGMMGHDADHCYKLHPELRVKKLASEKLSSEILPDFHLNVFLGKQRIPCRALVDTGADCNIVRPDLLEKLGKEKTIIPCEHSLIHGKDSSVKVKESLDSQLTFSTVGDKLCTSLIRCLVSDITGGDELIISGAWAKNHGILELLASRESPMSNELVLDLETVLQDKEMNINEKFATEIGEVVDKHKIVFDEKLPREGSRLPKFTIELINPKVLWSVKPRRFSPADDKVLRDNLSEGLKNGVLVKRSSPYVCSPTFVDRPDGGVRMCINNIPLNKNTVPLQYPIPIVTELLDSLKGSKIFGKIDARSGFHQILVDEESQKYLAFITKYGVYQYTRMPFGARNASAHFQQAMISAFSDLIPHACDIFVDDIIIKGTDITDFCLHLDQVLSKFEELNLRAKSSKCVFGFERVEFLGREVSCDGISPAPSRIADLKSLKPPKDKSQCRSVLGLFKFFRSFVDNYADKVAPIQILTRKQTPFTWKETQQRSFDGIIADISKKTLLHYIDYEKHIVLQTDASDLAIGGVLLQYGEEKVAQPVLFISKVLSDCEQRWTTNEKEAYALRYCVEKCEHYLRGTHFIIQTDHANLQWMYKAKSRKVQRWWVYLAEFDFEIVHIPGTVNVVADGLSRIGFGKSTLKKIIVDRDSIKKKILKAQPLFTDEEKEAYAVLEGFHVDKHERVVVPKEAVDLKKEIFEAFHSGVAGHHGAATNSLAQDMGKRLPKRIIKRSGRGRNERYEVQCVSTPCTAHLISSVIQHYMQFFFTQIEVFLEDLNVVLSTGCEENRALCSILKIHPPRYTKIRWTSLLEEYVKELQLSIIAFKSITPICTSTSYTLAHKLAKDDIKRIETKFKTGDCSLILDKVQTKGRSILAIMGKKKNTTYAIGYVDITKLKDKEYHDLLLREMQHSYEAEERSHLCQTIREAGMEKRHIGIRYLLSHLKTPLGYCPERLHRILESPSETLKDAIISEIDRIGIPKKLIRTIITDREPIMENIAELMINDEYGNKWTPCLSHILNSVISLYINYFFELVPQFLNDYCRALSTSTPENHAIQRIYKIRRPRFTPVRWSSMLEEYFEVCSHWDDLRIAFARLKSPNEDVCRCKEFLDNDGYRSFADILMTDFIPLSMKSIRVSQHETPTYEAFVTIRSFRDHMLSDWRAGEIRTKYLGSAT
ncbi:DDE-type integrase/transposase/recombinase [Aduncisulcus paluster]|uniref:DDE-type integrase/transposase/recombinase n=1 Tax=Aduncisulcus paluster TaxID=2918883 RepID=A0ABQ5KNE8_9EUKA|nr:DDE-type integrase/transposase/recombinase [Aduncisulcus paluster]